MSKKGRPASAERYPGQERDPAARAEGSRRGCREPADRTADDRFPETQAREARGGVDPGQKDVREPVLVDPHSRGRGEREWIDPAHAVGEGVSAAAESDPQVARADRARGAPDPRRDEQQPPGDRLRSSPWAARRRVIFRSVHSGTRSPLEGTRSGRWGQARRCVGHAGTDGLGRDRIGDHRGAVVSAFLLVLLIVHLGTSIPNAPGNVGTYQFFCVVALSFFGIDKARAAGFSIAAFVILTAPFWAIGSLALARSGLSLRGARAEAEEWLDALRRRKPREE